jgi:sarcosine oxidase
MKTLDVIVVGLGGIGSAVLYQLARNGLKVLGVDRFRPPHSHGSSYGGTRLIRKAYFEDPRYIPLLRRSYALWDELSEACGISLFHRTGFLTLSDGAGDIAKRMVENASTHGVLVESLGATAVRRRFPQFTLPDEWQGLLEVDAGYLRVEDAISSQLRLARETGALVEPETQVLGWDARGDAVTVRTTAATYDAGALVLVPGGWSRSLLPGLDLSLTLRRAPQFWFPSKPQHAAGSGMPCFAFSRAGEFIYGFPSVDGAGVKIANYEPSDIITDMEARDRTCTPQELAPIASAISRHLIDISPSPQASSVCVFTLTPHENFILDRHPAHPNVILFSGDSGHAFKFAPVLGERIAHLVTGQRPAEDIAFLKLAP